MTTDKETPLFLTSRRQFLTLLGAASAVTAIAPRAFANGQDDDHDHDDGIPTAIAQYVYVGTYTIGTAPGGSKPTTALGIYVYKLHPYSGDLSFVEVMPCDNPSFLALDPTKKFLYAVNELGPVTTTPPVPGGQVSAYSINPLTGKLTFINQVDSHGTYPCHVWVHPAGGWLFAANYGGTPDFPGSYICYKLNGNGSIVPTPTSDPNRFFKFPGNGTGPDPIRQEVSHGHMMLTDPHVKGVYGVDLGMDMVHAWTFDTTLGHLMPGTVPYASVGGGSGCRHMTFHPSGKFAYVINELASTVDAFDFDETRGAFIWIQDHSTLPKNTKFTRPSGVAIPSGTSTCSEIRIHPTGKWLYGANRGANVITMFAVNQKTGKLDLLGWADTKGKIPRGMNVDPSGTFLYVGNQDTDTIAVFRIDEHSGKLKGPMLINSPTPVDFEFGPPA